MTPRDALAAVGAISLFVVAVRIGIYVLSRIADDARARHATRYLVGRSWWSPDMVIDGPHKAGQPIVAADDQFRPAPGAAGSVTPQCPARRGTALFASILIAVTAAILACAAVADAAPPTSTTEQQAAPPTPPAIEVHFSPHGGCQATVVALIAGARGSVRLAAYQFTSEPIARALIDAHARGRDVLVVVDRSSARSKQVAALRTAGVPVVVDAKHHIFHDKFVVVDGSVVETGSFNYTDSAEHSNAENCVTIRDGQIAKQFGANWLGHHDHSAGGGS